ncbi:MAG: uroporphyrinogen-III C-methyltransferase [Sandaracinus sp.]
MQPRVFLLGAGPGDPELITRRAARRLAEVDLVLYDALVHPDLLGLARDDAEKVFVGKRAGRVSERQDEIHRRIEEAVRAGKRVARLKGGDPYLFGRGSEEAEFLANRGIPFEVVPGVPSPLAAAAYAGLALTHRDASSSIAYVTATESAEKDRESHDWARLATATETIVFFMGLRRLGGLMETLIAHGRSADAPAAVVERASLPTQRTVVGTVGTIAARAAEAGLGTPALVIVGEIVRLREKLRWFDVRPLFGARVLVMRPEGQTDSLVQLLRDESAEPIVRPILRIVGPTDPGPFTRAVAALGSYAWIVLTSANGVDALLEELARTGRDARAFGAAKVVAIGPATAARLRERGIVADLVPAEFRGEAVADGLLAQIAGRERETRVLVPRAEVAREALPKLLAARGVPVEVVASYRTDGPTEATRDAIAGALSRGEIDVVTLTSPSSVERLLEALAHHGLDPVASLERVTTASIGPVTSEAAAKLGVRVDATATRYTAEGLVDALVGHVAANGLRCAPPAERPR